MKTIIAFLALMLGATTGVLAEQSQKFAGIEVHYSAIPTNDLQPEIAKSYNITRSKNRGLLTIAVLKKNKLDVAVPIKAQLNASAVNLAGQRSKVPMREVQEGTAIYYLGEYPVTAPDTLKFSVTVTQEGEKTPHMMEFQQQFFE